MNKLLPAILASVLLFAGGGCKPSPTADTSQATPPPDGSASRQPSADDSKNFLQRLLPSALRLSDFKADAPVRQPNTAPEGNAWTMSVKVTLTPTEDLLAPAPLEQANAFYAPISDLNDLKAWRNTYVRSIYARTYGAFDVPVLADPVHLLVVQQAKDKPLPALYGKVAAEWQIDHWNFSNLDVGLPALGQPRAAFTDGPTLILGSPEAEAVAAAQRKGMDEGVVGEFNGDYSLDADLTH